MERQLERRVYACMHVLPFQMKFNLMRAFISTQKKVLYFLNNNRLMSIRLLEKDRSRLKNSHKIPVRAVSRYHAAVVSCSYCA